MSKKDIADLNNQVQTLINKYSGKDPEIHKELLMLQKSINGLGPNALDYVSAGISGGSFIIQAYELIIKLSGLN